MNAPIRVLLVEDHPGDARLIREMLAEATRARFAVEWVDRLAAARERLLRSQLDLVLLDLSLPDSQGFGTFAAIQAQAGDLPIIVLTGFDDEELGIKTVHAGAQDYLVKGQVDSPLLVRSLRYAIERKKVERQLADYAEQLRLKNADIEAELKMAREIQQAFLPRHAPTFPPHPKPGENVLRFCYHYQPSATLAGDFFDVLEISPTEVGVFLCDVMGHGVRASLITAFLRGLIEEMKPIAADPGRFLTEINRGLVAVLRRAETFMFASAFYLVVDFVNAHARHANAGHPEPFHVRRRAREVTLLDNRRGDPEPALGLIEDFAHATHERSLDVRDLIFLYTDGLCEVMDGADQQFGEERLRAGIHKRLDIPCPQLFQELLEETHAFSHTDEFADDVCIVGVELDAAAGEAGIPTEDENG